VKIGLTHFQFQKTLTSIIGLPSSFALFTFIHALFLPVIFINRGVVELSFNLFTNPSLYHLFKVITFVGDGLFAIPTTLYIIYLSKKNNLSLKRELTHFLFTFAIMGIGIFFLKEYVFTSVPRPISFFNPLPAEWDPKQFSLTFHKFRSFPSGHSAAAAVYGFFIMRYFKSISIKTLIFISVLIVAYSRVFLFQHFVVDTYFGVFFGILCVFAANMIKSLIFKKNK
jgi:membrane-associated phospholipid phosphatase|tara:strand:+ start:66 stop:743 length:678 start_codon:yes stop_codon:yes gene_type:complete